MPTTPSANDVLAFLVMPSLVSLPLTDLEYLASLPRPSEEIMRLWSSNERRLNAVLTTAGAAVNASTLNKCRKLVRAKRVGDAVHRLESSLRNETPVDLQDPANKEAMEALHPVPTDGDKLPNINMENFPPIELSQDDITGVIKDLPKESGAGLFSWTYELIQLCYHEHSLKQSIVQFVNKMTHGELHHSKLWLQSKLIGIRKNPTKLRPIAVADVWIRLAGRVLSTKSMDQASNIVGSKYGKAHR